MKKYFLLMALGMACGVELFAQTLTSTSNFVLNVDYARFRNNDQSGYLEVYYGFYPHLLTYRLSDGVYRAGVKLRTRVWNKATQVVAQQVLLPLAITDTSSASYRFPFITQAGYMIPFGEYILEVLAVDSLNSSRRDSISLPIKFQPYPETISLSDVELCSKVVASSKKDDAFFKNSLEVVPNPALVFGVATHPMLFNYVELYNLDPAATYTAKRQLVAPDGKVVKESSQPRQYGMKNGIEASSMNVTAVVPGKYAFRLLLLDESGRELGRSEKTVFIYNPHLQAPASGPAASPFQATQLAGLSDAELTKEFQQVQYLATSDETKMFAQLTSETGKREFLANFWSQVELGRFDRPPVKRAEYLRRVAAVNQNFTVLGREGWRTDRGRIYLLYGDPDQIDRFPGETESKPYQIWRYFSIERGVEFVFIDRWGDSNFYLVHSTKRGELQDDAWQRFLQ